MAQKLFVNIPIKDLSRSRHFFESLGFEFNPQFSNDDGMCLVLGDNFYGMLLKEEFFQTFTKKPTNSGKETTEVILSLMVDSIVDVHRMVDKAIELGAHEYIPPVDNGFMLVRAFEDLDGHQWEVSWMDENYNWDDLNKSLD